MSASAGSSTSAWSNIHGLKRLLDIRLWLPHIFWKELLLLLCWMLLFIWSHDVYSPVYPGEGSSSVAVLKVSSLFFYFLGVFPDARSVTGFWLSPEVSSPSTNDEQTKKDIWWYLLLSFADCASAPHSPAPQSDHLWGQMHTQTHTHTYTHTPIGLSWGQLDTVPWTTPPLHPLCSWAYTPPAVPRSKVRDVYLYRLWSPLRQMCYF